MTAFEDLTEIERVAINQARAEEAALRRVYASASSPPPLSPSYTVRQITNADGSRTIVEELTSTTTRKITDSGYAPSPSTQPAQPPPSDQPRHTEPSSFAESVTAAIASRLGKRLAKVQEYQPDSASRPKTYAELVAEKVRLRGARR
jgi:hypothetical protein